MATCEAMYYKGHKIGAIANIAVQGVGVKGGVLTNDGTGVWRSADGLVSFTPADGITVTEADIRQQGNIVTVAIRINDVSFTAGSNVNYGTVAGVTLPSTNRAAVVRAWQDSYVVPNAYIGTTGDIFITPSETASSVRFILSCTYSVPASGSVNPADSKTMLVDNDNAAYGSVNDWLGGVTPTPGSVDNFVAQLDAMPFGGRKRWGMRLKETGVSYSGSSWVICNARRGGAGSSGLSSSVWDLDMTLYYAGDTTYSVGAHFTGIKTAVGATPTWYQAALTAV